MKCHGTMVTVTQHYLKCKDEFQWKSQPPVMGKYPAGNVLLITKKLLKASKKKECEVISSWIRGIRKHLYWCATSSKLGSLISALAFFLRHVANKHKNHPDPLYTGRNHGDLQRRKWIKVGNFQFVVTSLLSNFVVC